MKIFIVQSHLGGGGAEHVGCILANGFVAGGHKTFIVSNLNLPIDYAINDGVGVLNIIPCYKNSMLRWAGALRNLRKFVIKYKPDVIVGIMQLSSFISKVACIGTKTKVVMTEHYAFDRSPFGSLTMFETLNKFYLNIIYDLVTVLTEVDKSVIGKRLNNVVVMPNPLSLPSIEMRNINKSNVMLAVGRLDAWYVKGFDVLIKSFANLLNGSKVAEPRSKFKGNDIAFKIREERWKLQIAGTGSEENLNYLKQLCKENGVEDSVEFLGFRKDVENLYQEASVFVLSSRYEGFGLVLIEAMSQGCACIACDYKGRQREIMIPEGQGSKLPPSLSRAPRLRDSTASVDDLRFKVQSSNNKVEQCETGILCEPDDVEALAEAMKKMIVNDEYRESVRTKAIERSKYYSVENTMDRWETLLSQVID